MSDQLDAIRTALSARAAQDAAANTPGGGQQAPAAAPVVDDSTPAGSLRAALAARAAQDEANAKTPAAQPADNGIFDNKAVQALDSFSHNLVKPVVGGAQLALNLAKAGANALPDNPVSRAFSKAVDSANADIAEDEAAYQRRNPDSMVNDAAAVGGTVLPFMIAGPAKALQGAGDYVAGKVASSLPAWASKAAPVIAPVVSGLTQGAIVGADAPVSNGGDYWDQKDKDIRNGAVIGGIIPPAAAAVGSVGRSLADAAAPIIRPQKIVQPVADALVGNDPAVLARLQNPDIFVPGSTPTTAQVITGPEAVATEKAFANSNPDFKIALAKRFDANNAARLSTLNDLAGTDQDMQAALDARAAAAQPMLDQIAPTARPVWRQNLSNASDAVSTVLDNPPRMSGSDLDALKQANKWINSAMRGNIDAPTLYANLASLDVSGNAARTAIDTAGKSLQNMGNLVDAGPVLSAIQKLQTSSLGVDPVVKRGAADLLSGIQDSIANTNEGGTLIRPDLLDGYRQNVRNILKQYGSNGVVASKQEAAFIPVRDAIVGQIEQTNPGYRAYLADYAKNSVPINTMETVRRLVDNVAPDFRAPNSSGDAQITLNKLGSQLQAQTDNSQYGIDPFVQKALTDVQSDLAREAISNGFRTAGSDTAYNASAKSWLARQMYGNTFAGKTTSAKAVGGALGAAAGAVGGAVGGPYVALGAAGAGAKAGSWAAEKIAQLGQDRVNAVMQRVLLDPEFAAQLALQARAAQTSPGALGALGNLLGSVSSGVVQASPEVAVASGNRSPNMTVSGAKNIDQAIAAAHASVNTEPAFKGAFGPDGTYRIQGDPAAINAHLRQSGLPVGLPMRGGVMIGRDHSPAAARLFSANPASSSTLR